MKKRYFVFTVKVSQRMETHYVGIAGGRYISIRDMAGYIFGNKNKRGFAVLFLTELSEKDFKDLIEKD